MPSGYLRTTRCDIQTFYVLGALLAFVCFVRISKQTATSFFYDIKTLVLYNRGGECLQRGTDWVLI